MTLTASTQDGLAAAWRRAWTAEGLPPPHGAAELRRGVSGPVQVIWRGQLTTLWIGGEAAPDPRRPRR